MRLIDADKVFYSDVNCVDGNTYMVVHAPMIDKQPTAYDVDKVVEQLEEERKRAFELCLAINDKAQRHQYIIKEQAMALAIEIVKAGGIDD